MRDQSTLLLQLAFSLTVVFAAFAAGMTVGWLRWARRSKPGTGPSGSVPILVKPDLFAPMGSQASIDIRFSASPVAQGSGDAGDIRKLASNADGSTSGRHLVSVDTSIPEAEAPSVVRRRARGGGRGRIGS